MTMIDYAKYLLNVCGRRFTHLYRRHYLESTTALPSLSALLSYLKTQTASIFTQIKARGAVHPLSGLPTTETLATLPTAIATLNSRKIDVGTNDIDDGELLPPLLCCLEKVNKITELYDNSRGWTYNINDAIDYILAVMPNLQVINLGIQNLNSYRLTKGTNRTLRLNLELEDFYIWNRGDDGQYIGSYNRGPSCTNVDVYFNKLKNKHMPYSSGFGLFRAGRLYFPVIESMTFALGGHASYATIVTYYVYLGCMGNKNETIHIYNGNYNNPATLDVELRDGACQNVTIQNLCGLTEENIYNHILCKLKHNESGCGEGVTINIGSDNLAKLTSAESVAKLAELSDIYGYTFA